jgi:hypothetical protein
MASSGRPAWLGKYPQGVHLGPSLFLGAAAVETPDARGWVGGDVVILDGVVENLPK